MKNKNYSLLFILIIIISAVHANSQNLIQRFEFADKTAGAKILNTADDYVKAWSEFDINSRARKAGATTAEALKYMSAQTLDWTPEEISKLKECFINIQAINNINAFKLNLPDKIFFAKTTGEEESGAEGFTRSNYIFFSESTVSKDKEELCRYIVHELFHVISRYDAEFRRNVYKTIGFNMCNEIKLPISIGKYKISNPDAVKLDNYITVTIKGKQVDCLIVLLANEEYTGGKFFDYARLGFLKLTGVMQKNPEILFGQPDVYIIDQISDFWEKVGQNTQYVISAEEIAADNFSYVWFKPKQLPNPEIVDNIRKLMINGN